MKKTLHIGIQSLTLAEVTNFATNRYEYDSITIDPEILKRAQKSNDQLQVALNQKIPLYGVTTGFGDSCHRIINQEQSEKLQANLVRYLVCGSGKFLPLESVRASFLIRLNSFCRGLSAVSLELIERMRVYLEKDWIPQIPCQGSLGASGDLVPLAYIAQALQGNGTVIVRGEERNLSELLAEENMTAYQFKPKEGLALVNGTSSMAGLSVVNLKRAERIFEIAQTCTAWIVLALRGRTEAFSPLVNSNASRHIGQSDAAGSILSLLEAENYKSVALKDIGIEKSETTTFVQDRYSIRCSPQILGPVKETIELFKRWVHEELHSATDNPLITEEGQIANGGNFYGGYLSHGNDYLKISMSHVADMLDRQLTLLIDDKSNRGLPANLANWEEMPENERFLHHGLKGLHQSMSAITSEVMSKAIPNGIFSRSSESHNQDKVSLGMSAAVQCSEMLDKIYDMLALYSICLCQALDLRKMNLTGKNSVELYEAIRGVLAKVSFDRPLDKEVRKISQILDQHGAQGTT